MFLLTLLFVYSVVNPVVQQPMNINNVFSITGDETIRRRYECDETVCGCGATYSVTLTDARIIQRYQDHVCGCNGSNVDSMLFLSDISSIKDRVEREGLCPKAGCGVSGCCMCLFFPIGLLCCLLHKCSDKGVPITLKGAFGTEVFTLPGGQVRQALADIPAAALPHKVSSRNPTRSAY